MKTLNLISALTVLLFAMTTIESNAFTPDMNNGALDLGGNDLMTNSMIVTNSFENNVLPEFDFDDEAYINDIPFSTECVTAKCRFNKAMSVVFEIEEEEYVNDIPFNTKYIAENSNSKTVDFQEEAYIDDIPFNTATIVVHADNKNDLTAK